MTLFDVSKMSNGLNNDINTPSDGIIQNGTSSSFEYPPLPSSASSSNSPFTPKLGSNLSERNSSGFLAYQQNQRQIYLTSSDEFGSSRDQDSDVYFSLSGENSGTSFHERSASDSKGFSLVSEEISDLLGSLRLRDKSGNSEEEKRKKYVNRHSFNAPTTYNEIRLGADQSLKRRRTLSSTSATLFKFNTENSFLNSTLSSNSLSFPKKFSISGINPLSKLSLEELTASPLTSTTNQLLESSELNAVAMKTSTPAKETLSLRRSQSNLVKTSSDPIRKGSAPSNLSTQPASAGSGGRKQSDTSSGSAMNSRSTPSRKISRPVIVTSNAPRSTGARTTTRPTVASSRTLTSSAPKYTAISTTSRSPAGATGLSSGAGAKNLGSAGLSKAPSFNKTRSASSIGANYVRPGSRNGLGSSDRTTIHATPRSKTPTLAPGFQTLSDKKSTTTTSTTRPTSTTSKRILGSTSPSTNSLRNSSQSSAPSSRSNSSSKLTSPARSTSLTKVSPARGRSGSSSSTAAASTKRIQSSTLSSNRQTSPKTTPKLETSPAKSQQAVTSSLSPARTLNTHSTSQLRTPLTTTSTTKSPSVSPQSPVRKQNQSPVVKTTVQPPKYSTISSTSLSRSKSLITSVSQSKPTVRTQPQPQTTQKTPPTRKQSSTGQPFKRTPILPKQSPVPVTQDKPPVISVTGAGNDIFDIPLFVPSRPEGTNHKIQVRNGRVVKRPNRILMQQNASENYLETLPIRNCASVPSSPALGRATPDFSDGEDPRNAKLDVKSFKFLLKTREKDSLLLGAAERSPTYTSHEHVLVKVKGKRQVHARITEPKITSVNKGNAYIFISLQELWLWVGPDANPAELSKARSLANRIFKQKELGCKAIFLSEIDHREQTFNTTRTSVLFNALQGKEKDIESSSIEDSDEIYEKGMTLATKVYEVLRLENGDYIASIVHEDKYISVKTTLLKTEKVLVFDFGTEVYLWVGKQSASDPQLRKLGEKFAREIFDNCYNEPTFDPNLILTKTNSSTDTTNKFLVSASLMTNRATGQKEKNLEGKAIGVPSAEKISTSPKRTSGATPKAANTSSARNITANRTKVSSTLGSSTSASRDRTTSGNRNVTITTRREQLARPSSTPPKKPHERRQAVPIQASTLSRARSNVNKRPSNSNITRPRSQEGNREDMLAPEHKQPVYTNQTRPAYSVLARMNEGAETVLFGDKFSDWKGALGLISTKPSEAGKKNAIAAHVEQKTCDTQEMLKERKVPTSIVDPVVKRLQANNAKTVSLRKWLVKEYNNEFKHYERDREEFSIFYSKECYVFKWIYEHASDFPSRNNLKTTSSNKERGMIFFWQGDCCSINAKGAVAAVSIEIDENGDLHKERLPQGKEDALFLQLFNGGMTVFCGKLDDDHEHDKLFFVRGSHPSEACAIEVLLDSDILLNQLGCCIYCCEEAHTLYAWKGSKVLNHQISCLEVVAETMALRRNFDVVYVDEGNEPGVLKNMKTSALSLAQPTVSKRLEYTPHLFELSGASGQFTFNQYIPQIYTQDTNSLIFLQLDLYSAQQPTIFMLDAYYEVYVWFGWWPSKTHNSRSHVVSESLTNTGVSDTRWQNDKKLAIQTALNYVKDAARTNCQVYATFAGSEPESFQRLFPFWRSRKDLVGVCRNDNPFHPQGKIIAEDLLATYTRTRYTYAELAKRPLPDGVDPAKLEMYLSEKEFESIFNMDKSEFAKLPLWRQKLLREQHQLY